MEPWGTPLRTTCISDSWQSSATYSLQSYTTLADGETHLVCQSIQLLLKWRVVLYCQKLYTDRETWQVFRAFCLMTPKFCTKTFFFWNHFKNLIADFLFQRNLLIFHIWLSQRSYWNNLSKQLVGHFWFPILYTSLNFVIFESSGKKLVSRERFARKQFHLQLIQWNI